MENNTAQAYANAANAAFVEEDYVAALDLYTHAVKLAPSDPSLFLKRAITHEKMCSYDLARDDARYSSSSYYYYYYIVVLCLIINDIIIIIQ